MSVKKEDKLHEELVRLKMILQVNSFEEVFGVRVKKMMYEVENDGNKMMFVLDRKESEE